MSENRTRAPHSLCGEIMTYPKIPGRRRAHHRLARSTGGTAWELAPSSYRLLGGIILYADDFTDRDWLVLAALALLALGLIVFPHDDPQMDHRDRRHLASLRQEDRARCPAHR